MKKYIITLIRIAFILTAAIACKKENATNNPATPPAPVVQLPVLTTSDVSSITQISAACGGNITSDGGAKISARGICWSTKDAPTTADNITIDGTGTGAYTSALKGLTGTTVYYVRAYAINSLGTAYGNTQTFGAFEIGQEYGGGRIAYILKPDDPAYAAENPHGIIVSLTSYNGFKWFNGTYTTTFATFTGYGTGNANTDLIVSIMGPGDYAAALCSTEKTKGYTDWYLPSKDELNKVYLARDKISSLPLEGYFWTSSEAGNSTAWIQSFDTGVQSTYDKNGSGFWTWAIRTF
jgi:hypothetical protein